MTNANGCRDARSLRAASGLPCREASTCRLPYSESGPSRTAGCLWTARPWRPLDYLANRRRQLRCTHSCASARKRASHARRDRRRDGGSAGLTAEGMYRGATYTSAAIRNAPSRRSSRFKRRELDRPFGAAPQALRLSIKCDDALLEIRGRPATASDEPNQRPELLGVDVIDFLSVSRANLPPRPRGESGSQGRVG